MAKRLGGDLVRSKKLGGLANESYRLDVNAQGGVKRFSVKVYRGSDARLKAEKELKLYELLPKYGLKAPKVSLADTEGVNCGKPLLAWEWIEGHTADELLGKKRVGEVVARSMGAALALFHRIPLGEVDLPLPERGEGFWASEINTVKFLAQLLDLNIPSDALDDLSGTSVKRLTLLHGDYNPGNVLIGSDGVYVMDLEGVSVGDPLFDVAYALAFISHGGRWREAFTFAREYFRLSKVSPHGLAHRLALVAARIRLFLDLAESRGFLKWRTGTLYPLVSALYLRSLRKHLDTFSRKILSSS